MHLLSFDVEEYFHVEAARSAVAPTEWASFEQRLGPCVRGLLDLLETHSITATFFVLGWIAQHHPEFVQAIAQGGHEVASHGMTHSMLTRLTPEQFRQELQTSRKLLEDISGSKVVGYRAPTFSVTRQTSWALDVLVEAGYTFDSSIFPIRHDRYGIPDAPRWAHRAVGPAGGEILEIPPLTLRMCGMNLPVGGGGYLRLLPSALVRRGLKVAEKLHRPGMIYLHPWEFDPGQPVLPMGKISRWRHRVNLHKTEAKLSGLLRKFSFGSVADYLKARPAETLERYVYTSNGRHPE